MADLVDIICCLNDLLSYALAALNLAFLELYFALYACFCHEPSEDQESLVHCKIFRHDLDKCAHMFEFAEELVSAIRGNSFLDVFPTIDRKRIEVVLLREFPQ